MKFYVITILFLTFYNSVQSQLITETVVPNKFGKYLFVKNHQKSLEDFRFKIPEGFEYLREGNDNSVIKIFRKKISSNKLDFFGKKIYYNIDFGITVLKWRDYPKYKMLLNKSDLEIKKIILNNSKSRDKTVDPNESRYFYEINNNFWTIVVTWSNEKNLYVIICQSYSNQQTIQFSFMTDLDLKNDINVDVNNLKSLIDTFEFVN
ncbi:MAG: hypothetical protein P8H25_07060 [Flavobacteriaceae bacterium]|nr:hypothetical protein [Flavobacteriaceae bacterium]